MLLKCKSLFVLDRGCGVIGGGQSVVGVRRLNRYRLKIQAAEAEPISVEGPAEVEPISVQPPGCEGRAGIDNEA